MPFGLSVKMEVPEALRPEVPGLNTLKKMTKHEPVKVIRLSDGGHTITITDMMLAEHWLFDDLKKIRYMQNHDSIKLRILTADQKPHSDQAYIVDDDTASTVELPDLIKKLNKPVKIKAVSVDGVELECLQNEEVPENIRGYTAQGSTISLISSDKNSQWYSAGPEEQDKFYDNKAISDMFPSSINPGWFAVLFVIAFTMGGFICGIAALFIGIALF